MNKPSLSAIFRRATAAADAAAGDSGIAADDVARLASGERLGQRHDSAVEALAGSPAALAAFRVASDIEPAARALAQGFNSNVSAMPQRARAAAIWPAAMAAGVLGVAVVGGFLLKAPQPGAPESGLSAVPGSINDQIFSVSYESDGAVVATPADKLFVDEFDS